MLAEMIQTLIRQQDLDLLPVGAIDRATASALERYSADFPLEKMVDVNVSGELLNMPPDWVDGFSQIMQVQHPADGSLIPTVQPIEPTPVPSGDDGAVISFVFENWQLSGGEYYLDLTHGLESTFLQVQAYESSGQKTEFGRVTPFTTNKIRVWVNAKPDARFAGTAIIERA